MAITDAKLLGEAKHRCNAIATALLGASNGARERLYEKLAVARFAEFLQAKQGEQWLSHTLLVQKFNFPYKLVDIAGLTEADIFFLVEREAEYREETALGDRLLTLAAQVHTRRRYELAAELSSLVTIKSKVQTELDGKALYDARKNRPQGILTGIRRYDDLTHGIGYGTLTVITGYVASYKSILDTCLLYNAAELGYQCVDITLELTKDQRYYRYLARHSYHPRFHGRGEPINSLHIDKGLLTPEQEKFMWEVVEPDFKALPGRIIILEQMDVPGWDFITLKSFLASFGDIDVVSLDYMQQLMLEAIAGGSRIRDPRDYGNWLIGEFRKLAVGSENPEEPGDYGQRKIVVLVSQTNRAGWENAVEHHGAYDLTALSDLNMLDRASSYVISVFLDEDLRAGGQVKTQLLKHRGGEPALDPMPVPADPRYAVVGDGIAGFVMQSQSVDMRDIFGGGMEL